MSNSNVLVFEGTIEQYGINTGTSTTATLFTFGLIVGMAMQQKGLTGFKQEGGVQKFCKDTRVRVVGDTEELHVHLLD